MNKQAREVAIEQVVAEIYEAYPEILERFGEAGKARCYEDNHHHFDYLETAAKLGQPEAFTNYATWLTILLTARGMNKNHVIDNFQRIHDVLETTADTDAKVFQKLLKQGIQTIQ
jgi:hypothetical protein